MPVRLFTIAIVFFWLGSVAWLCTVVWAPPGSRMAKIDPREVYRVFFGWNESTRMTLLENGARRGQVIVTGASGIDTESGTFERFLSLSGTLENYDERSASVLVDVFWKGTLEFDEAMARKGGEFSLRIPGRDLKASLAFEETGSSGEKPAIEASVELAGREVLSVDSATSGDPAAILAMLGPLGSIPGLGSVDPTALKFTTEARVGRFNLAGREMRAFLLTLRGSEAGQELRVFLSEAGEPLRIETDLGFEAVSEILVPLDAYKRPDPANRDDR